MSDAPLPRIAGLGLLTPFGDREQTWQSLLAGQYLTAPTPIKTTADPLPSPRILPLALAAARMALDSARRTPDALIVGTSKGPIEAWITPPPPTSDNTYVIGGLQPAGLADLAARLAQALAIPGPSLTYSGACASGLHALVRGAMMIRFGEATSVLVVAAESSLHPLFIASYERLGVLADENGCRPFDHRRSGFVPSEAAAAILLAAQTPSDTSCLVLDRFTLASDPTHLTASDPQGRPLIHLLKSTLAGQPCDLIHAHGTGTQTNDPIELLAIESSLPDAASKPILYSHKAALGHTLGASGVISVILNCLAHRDGAVPGNIRSTNPLPMTGVAFPTSAIRQQSIRRSLALAAGFGGALAAVSITSLEKGD